MHALSPRPPASALCRDPCSLEPFHPRFRFSLRLGRARARFPLVGNRARAALVPQARRPRVQSGGAFAPAGRKRESATGACASQHGTPPPPFVSAARSLRHPPHSSRVCAPRARTREREIGFGFYFPTPGRSSVIRGRATPRSSSCFPFVRWWFGCGRAKNTFPPPSPSPFSRRPLVARARRHNKSRRTFFFLKSFSLAAFPWRSL